MRHWSESEATIPADAFSPPIEAISAVKRIRPSDASDILRNPALEIDTTLLRILFKGMRRDDQKFIGLRLTEENYGLSVTDFSNSDIGCTTDF
jgi:hypothetical protein